MSSLLFLQNCFLIVIITAMIIASTPTPCPKSCGDIAIPHPFGIGSKCSKIESGELICDSSSNPPILSFRNSKRPTSIKHIDPISRTVIMSCATKTGYERPFEEFCQHLDGCREDGCCKTIDLMVMNEGPCRWSFCVKGIQEDTRTHTALASSKNITCQEAQKAGGRAVCGHNAECVNLIPLGYTCVCLEGYKGDPFKGCRDINECILKEGNPCAQNAICHNLLGGYNCSCIENYEGDGLKNGSGCTLRHLRIYIALGSVAIIVLGFVCYRYRRYFRDRLQERIDDLVMEIMLRHRQD